MSLPYLLHKVRILAAADPIRVRHMPSRSARLSEPDSDLVYACVEALAVDKRCDVICNGVKHLPFVDPRSLAVADEFQNLMPRFHTAVASVAALPVCTQQGWSAKAEVLTAYTRTNAYKVDIALSLVHDLLESIETQA